MSPRGEIAFPMAGVHATPRWLVKPAIGASSRRPRASPAWVMRPSMSADFLSYRAATVMSRNRHGRHRSCLASLRSTPFTTPSTMDRAMVAASEPPDELLNLIYDAATEEELWTSALTNIADLTGSLGGFVFGVENKARMVTFTFNGRM